MGEQASSYYVVLKLLQCALSGVGHSLPKRAANRVPTIEMKGCETTNCQPKRDINSLSPNYGSTSNSINQGRTAKYEPYQQTHRSPPAFKIVTKQLVRVASAQTVRVPAIGVGKRGHRTGKLRSTEDVQETFFFTLNFNFDSCSSVNICLPSRTPSVANSSLQAPIGHDQSGGTSQES